jgi:hypothetical protein
MGVQVEENNELVDSRRVPDALTLSSDPGLPSSWIFGIFGGSGALFL